MRVYTRSTAGGSWVEREPAADGVAVSDAINERSTASMRLLDTTGVLTFGRGYGVKIVREDRDGLRLYMPGTAGNQAFAPDESKQRVTGDLDVRIEANIDNMATGTAQVLLGKWTGDNSYRLEVTPAGALMLILYDGTSVLSAAVSDAAVGPGGTRRWLRATWEQATGDVKFYESQDAEVWTQLGGGNNIAAASIHRKNGNREQSEKFTALAQTFDPSIRS